MPGKKRPGASSFSLDKRWAWGTYRSAGRNRAERRVWLAQRPAGRLSVSPKYCQPHVSCHPWGDASELSGVPKWTPVPLAPVTFPASTFCPGFLHSVSPTDTLLPIVRLLQMLKPLAHCLVHLYHLCCSGFLFPFQRGLWRETQRKSPTHDLKPNIHYDSFTVFLSTLFSGHKFPVYAHIILISQINNFSEKKRYK